MLLLYLLNHKMGGKNMSNLELAYLLQHNLDLIKSNKKILKDGAHIYFLRKLKKEFELKKQEYNSKKQNQQLIRENYVIISEKLKSQKKEVDDKEFKLYNKAGSNLNVISKLEKEIENGKQTLKKLEDDAVELLEDEEKINLEIENLRLELVNIRDNFYDYKNKSSQIIDNANEEIKQSEEKIQGIRNKIPKELSREIDKMLKVNDCAVARLKGNVCGGCKMRVSAVTLDSIYRGIEIVHCDNCGRILYYEDSKIIKKAK